MGLVACLLTGISDSAERPSDQVRDLYQCICRYAFEPACKGPKTTWIDPMAPPRNRTGLQAFDYSYG